MQSAVQAECQRQLDSFLSRNPALQFACLSRVDGRAFAHATARESIAAAGVSAITCSLLALAESFAKEALKSPCSYSAIATERGSIVLVRVPSRQRAFALSVGADDSQLIAMTLRGALDTAQALAQTIDQVTET